MHVCVDPETALSPGFYLITSKHGQTYPNVFKLNTKPASSPLLKIKTIFIVKSPIASLFTIVEQPKCLPEIVVFQFMFI